MRDGWTLFNMEDVCTKFGAGPFGSNMKVSTFVEEGIPVISGNHMSELELVEDSFNFISSDHADRLQSSIVQRNDVVITKAGTIGQVSLISEKSRYTKYVLSSRQLFVRPNTAVVNPKYLAILLKYGGGQEQILSNVNRTGVPSLSQAVSFIKKVKVELPSLPEQNRIVDLISSVDSYIHGLQQMLEGSKRLRNAVLHDLLAASGDGWVHKTLGEVAVLQMGRTPSRREPRYWTRDLDFPFCTIADMDSKFVDPKREGVTKLAIQDGRAKVAKGGTLLMSFKLTIGRMGFAARDIYPNEAIVMINANETEVLNDFLFLALGLMDLTEGSGRAVKGSTLNSGSIAAISLSIPPLTEQKRIVEILSPLDDMVNRARQAKEQSNILRSGLLSDLLSGEHEIPSSYDKIMDAA
jgi:type I restriction enzyme S subunit